MQLSKKILMVKASNLNDVRLQKYIFVLTQKGYKIDFLGWDRKHTSSKFEKNIENKKFVLKGFSRNKFFLFFGYFLWIFLAYFRLLFINKKKYDFIYCADFEAMLPVYMSCKFKKIKLIYDIYDEFSIRYKFPYIIKRILELIDVAMKNRAYLVVHVDSVRLNKYDNVNKTLIIENIPLDFDNLKKIDFKKKKFLVAGQINKNRGISSIYKFASSNKDFDFIVVGKLDSSLEVKKLESLINVTLLSYMPQSELFKVICEHNICAIFSLYNYNIEINQKAASNKLYDAMYLSIPVITNSEIYASSFVLKNEIGFVVNYDYDESWNILKESDLNEFKRLGNNGYKLFKKEYSFEKKVDDLLEKIKQNNLDKR